MKRFFVLSSLSAFVFVLFACSGPDAEGACKKFDSLCSSKSSGDAGTSVTVTVTCKKDQIEELSNAEEVVDCINGAADCNAAVACTTKGKR